MANELIDLVTGHRLAIRRVFLAGRSTVVDFSVNQSMLFDGKWHATGWQPGGGVVIALDDEPVFSVIYKIIFNGTTSPCLIVIPNDAERFGYRFMFAEVAPARKRSWWRSRLARVAPGSSIGMIYSSLQRCREYVPNEWTQAILFERVPAPS